jgi:hypothetical protein
MESRNIYLGLCTNKFNPFRLFVYPFSYWSWILRFTTYIHLIPYKYLCNLKKKVKNIEALIFVEEILTFISYYFESYLRRKINRIPKNDDGGEVPSNGYLSIFFNPG